MEYLYAILPIAALSLNVFLHILISRYLPKVNFLISVFAGFFTGLGALLCLDFLSSQYAGIALMDKAGYSVTGAITYLALGYCYFHFVNLGETARRIRLVRELEQSTTGLTLEEILQRYNAEEIISRRLKRLLNSGQIIIKDNRYCIKSPFMLLASKIMVFLKVLILGKKSEFD